MSDLKITHRAFREFEDMFIDWLDRNQDQLELGGTGNLKELATLCAGWRDSTARTQRPYRVGEMEAEHQCGCSK